MKYCSIGGRRGRGGSGGCADTGVWTVTPVDVGLVGFECTSESIDIAPPVPFDVPPEPFWSFPVIHAAFLYYEETGRLAGGGGDRRPARTHRLKLRLSTPTSDGLAEAHCGTLDGFGRELPRQILHVRGDVRRGLGHGIELDTNE